VQRLLIIAVVVLVVVAYMTTYTVRFTEQAVVTTFGKADAGSVIEAPGLKFRIPYAQRVTKYDKRARFLETKPETIGTADQKQLVVTAFLTWRIADPLKFYQRYSGQGDREESHYRAAENDLKSQLRSAMQELSKARMDELLTARGTESKVGEVESRLLARMASGGESGAHLAEWGIEAVTTGFTSIKFPKDTTEKVFDAMKANRAAIANSTISQGTSRAETIRQAAQADASRITAFADRLAKNIKVKGEIEAAEYLKQMNEEPELAVFLKNMEFMREAFSKQTTFILPTSMPGMQWARPDAVARYLSGQAPGPVMPGKAAPAGKPQTAAPSTTPAPTSQPGAQ
jgi:membrane protease subunit HflC